MEKDVVIAVKSVSKDFHYTGNKAGTIKSLVTGIFQSAEDKEADLQHALKNVSFEIKKGEFFGIVGRNGSGKSTLLKMLAGIYTPNKGSVVTTGKLVPFIELGVGFNPELTGRENVYLNGALLGFSKKEIERMYDDIVDFAELDKFMGQKLKNYSSGMQVRLAFSMAVRAHADILLIDEVLAVGDADFQRKCFDYFKELKRTKTTVVFVSHDMGAVREYCDRGILIEESKVVLAGSAEKIATQYNKMFLDQSTYQPNVEQERWGNGAVKIDSATAKVDKGYVDIKCELVVDEAVDNPVAGFRLRDAQGKDVLGTNTTLEKQKLGFLKPGQRLTVSWRFPDILSDGTYIVDPSVIYADTVTVSDWWDGATAFVVRKEKALPYAIDPGYELQIKQGKKRG